jgi:hypothetical protein
MVQAWSMTAIDGGCLLKQIQREPRGGPIERVESNVVLVLWQAESSELDRRQNPATHSDPELVCNLIQHKACNISKCVIYTDFDRQGQS